MEVFFGRPTADGGRTDRPDGRKSYLAISSFCKQEKVVDVTCDDLKKIWQLGNFDVVL